MGDKWVLYNRSGDVLGEVRSGQSLFVGRTFGGSVVDLKIENVRVSRKQLFLEISKDSIECKNTGVNPIHHFSSRSSNGELSSSSNASCRNGEQNRLKKISLFPTKIFAKDKFTLRHNEAVEFNVVKKDEIPITVIFGRKGMNLTFNVEWKPLPVSVKRAHQQRRRSSHHLIQKEVKHPANTSLGAQGEDEEEEEEDERVSIVDRLGTNFSFRAVMNDLSANQNGARVGKEFQAIVPRSIGKRIFHPEIRTFMERLEPKEDQPKEWSYAKKEAFKEALYSFPKSFANVAKEVSSKTKGEVFSKDCVEFYYREFKKSDDCLQWKRHFEDRDQFNAGANMSLHLQMQELDPSRKEIDDEEYGSSSKGTDGRKKKKRKKPKRSRSNELAKLVEAGVVKIGKGVLSLSYHGEKVLADLNDKGVIEFEGKNFESASAWSFFVKRRLNPKIRSDNGWSSVQHEGKSLSYFRSLYDPSMKTTLIKSSQNDEDELPQSLDLFSPSLETTPISEVEEMIKDLAGEGKVLLLDEGCNLMVGASEARLHFAESDKLQVESPKGQNIGLFGWFDGASHDSDSFFDEVVLLCFSAEQKVPSFVSLKELFFNWKKLKQLKREEDEKQVTEQKDELESQEDEVGKKRKRNDGWSKFDRYCVCRKKSIETTVDDWYLQCAKGTSFCHGWVHPSCFQLHMTRKEGESIDHFVCPLCSLDSIEFSYKSNASLLLKSKLEGTNLNFVDGFTKEEFRAVDLSRDNDPDDLTKRRVKYLPGTLIRSRFSLPNSEGKDQPLGWFLGRVIAPVNDHREIDTPKYKVEYGFAPGKLSIIDLENNPMHMLARDWELTNCFRSQDAAWRMRVESSSFETRTV